MHNLGIYVLVYHLSHALHRRNQQARLRIHVAVLNNSNGRFELTSG